LNAPTIYKSVFRITELIQYTPPERTKNKEEPDMSSARKKIVLITGASSGLGLETVKALMQSSQPYHIFLGCLILEDGEKAIVALKSAVPETESTAKAIQIDLRSDESIASCFEQINADPGYIDVLVNNAGLSSFPNMIQHTTPDL
jgi:NADP-dependent 3-hydroxy acid dehydrogenase YdfG